MAESERVHGSATVAFSDQLLATYYWAPRWMRALLPIAIIAAVISFAMTFFLGEETELWSLSGPLFLPGVLLLWGVATIAVFAVTFRRLSDEQRRVTYDIDSERITLRDDTGAAAVLPWTVVRRVVECKTGFAMAMKPAGMRWVPKRAFTAEENATLKGIVKAKLGKAAQLRR